jgi:hypothetical protein
VKSICGFKNCNFVNESNHQFVDKVSNIPTIDDKVQPSVNCITGCISFSISKQRDVQKSKKVFQFVLNQG